MSNGKRDPFSPIQGPGVVAWGKAAIRVSPWPLADALSLSLAVTMDPAAPAARMTSSFTINISTPSFYNPPKKFAPVVPPKPKVNPFRAAEEPVPQENSAGPGLRRAFVGKVGQIPSMAPPGGDPEDFVLPPPPPNEEPMSPPGSSFPPPPPSFGDDGPGSPLGLFPPPPPPEFSEPFPPPIEESFPSPPPLEEAAGLSDTQDPPASVPPPPPPLPSPPEPAPPVLCEAPKPAPVLPKPPPPSAFPKPEPPQSVAPKAQSSIFIPKPSPPSAVAPKPVAPPPVAAKPSGPGPFVGPSAAPPTHTPAPLPPAHTFSPKPVAGPTFAPKSASHTFMAKPSAPVFSPKAATEPPTEAPQERFPASQSSPKLTPAAKHEAPPPAAKHEAPPPAAKHEAPPPASATRAPGFSFAQQRDKPRVLEKPRANVRDLVPEPPVETRGERTLGPQAEGGRSFGAQPIGGKDTKPLPEGLRNQTPDGTHRVGGQPGTHRPTPHQDQTSGSQGLNMKEVEELEMLTQQLMQEMDKPTPAAEAHTMELCGFCGRGLSRTETVVRAGEHLYHVTCFTCSKCEQQLQGQQYYESAGKPLCEECYQDTLECCAVCEKKITERLLRAIGQAYHPSCFTCAVCKCSLQGEPFIVDDNKLPHCVSDYHRRYAPRCTVCGDPIAPEPGRDETVRVVALEKNFHMMCYKCEDCGCPLSIEADDGGCFPLDGHVLCKKCHTVRARAALG
ncbi:hypothetical protein XENTR_v10017504 [Xenopus tropicalis]|nr:hypothetical protein XENTR_v10017504 [Xenopus tropicalis]